VQYIIAFFLSKYCPDFFPRLHTMNPGLYNVSNSSQHATSKNRLKTVSAQSQLVHKLGLYTVSKFETL